MTPFRRPKSAALEMKNQLVALFHLQSTPRMADVVTWGYDRKSPSGRRDCCATALLCLLLVVCAVTISGLTSSMRLIYLEADLCETRDSTLAANQALMRNITNYYEGRQAASSTVNLTATAYYKAQDTYNALETRYLWPSPYDMSEEERQALELEAREGGDDCEPVEDCVGGVLGFVGGIFGQDTCVTVEVPCPDIDSTARLVEYDASQGTLDLFGRNITESQVAVNTTLAQTALDNATEAITVLVRRINFASSIYVLYLAFLVVVAPAFIVHGAKWNQRIFVFLGNVNKPMWIFLIVLVWYAHEVFKSIISSSYYQIIWSNFLHDPCWADPEFLVNTSLVIRETCTDITSANNLFSQASANYRYYDQVENTWQTALEGIGGPFYGDPEEDLLQTFPANCSASVLLDAIEPGDGSVNWWRLFFHSGALVALLLQIVLAHWFISWVNILRPLTMNRGRVMIPEVCRDDPVLYREVRQFARLRQVFPFIFTTIMLVFLLANLGASSSDSDMPRNVLIGSLVLAFFQFIVIPLLIWRPSDEALPHSSPNKRGGARAKNNAHGRRLSPARPSKNAVVDNSFHDPYMLESDSSSDSSHGLGNKRGSSRKGRGGAFSGRNPSLAPAVSEPAPALEDGVRDDSLAAAVRGALAASNREKSVRGVGSRTRRAK